MTKKKVFGIVGPTASGKTALSIALAQALGGEILCMDSMQVYRGMDIGTAKPTQAERAAAPHHLMDVADPHLPFSVTDYTALALPLLDSVPVPILVGGTGFYLRGLSEPMSFGFVPADEAVRRRYEDMARDEGVDALHRLLEEVDPPAAQKLHKNDVRRVVRALEVYTLTGKRFSDQKRAANDDSPYEFLLFALSFERDTLYRRIDERVDQMLAEGLTDEVERLLNDGVDENAQAMQGLGYKELVPVIRRGAPLDEAAALIKLRTRHYAKRQLTWFRADKRITWLPASGRDVPSLLNTILDKTES